MKKQNVGSICPLIGSWLPQEGTQNLCGLLIDGFQKFKVAVWNLDSFSCPNTILQNGWVYHKPTKVRVTESLW